MAFPTSPSNNQVHKEGNRAFVYDSAIGVWDQVKQQENHFQPRGKDVMNLGMVANSPTFPEGAILQTKHYNGMYGEKVGATSAWHVIGNGTGTTYFLSTGQMDAGTKASTDSITIRQDGSKLHFFWTSHPYFSSGGVSGDFGHHHISVGWNKESAGNEDRWRDDVLGYVYTDSRSTNGISGQQQETCNCQGYFGNGIKFRKGDVVYFGIRLYRKNSGAERGCEFTVQEIAA